MKITILLRTLICLFVLSASVFAQKLVADTTFTPTINQSVNLMEIQSDGKILIAGDFTLVNGVSRIKIARLNADGSLDPLFNANATTVVNGGAGTANIRSMELLPDGKILLGGSFGSGSPLEYTRVMVRLNANGSLDGTLTSIPQMTSPTGFVINKVEAVPGGKVLICGRFSMPNDNPQPWLARYNSNGTFDPTFTTVLDQECADVEVQPDGKYLVSGGFSSVNGTSRRGLTRFNADDSIDTSFAAPSAMFANIELQSDGTILAFQYEFSNQVLRRFNADGSLHTSFPAEMSKGWDMARQLNGKIIAAGDYRNVFGQSFDLNRYNADGTHDPSLDRLNFLGSSSENIPKAVSVAANGNVIVAGDFSFYTVNLGGQPVSRPYIVRFTPQAIPVKPKYDFDGDGKDDIGVFRPSDRYWYINQSSGGFSYAQFGLSADKPITADYDGDGRADIAVFRDGVWMWLRSTDAVFSYRVCGQAGDIPTPSYGTNAKADFLVFRPSAAQFYSQNIFQNAQPVEFRDMTLLSTDKPVIADYDGDGRDDLAVFRDGDWYFMASNSLDTMHFQFGLSGDIPTVGDFDGDGRSDLAVFRPSSGIWYIKRSNDGLYAVQWGISEDLPVPADYDGDGKTDIAVFRPSTGVWYQLRSSGSSHAEHFGSSGDIPAELR